MDALTVVLMLIVGIGHLAIWTRLHCFIHSLSFRQSLIDTGEYTTYIMSVLIPGLYLVWYGTQPAAEANSLGEPVVHSTLYYLWFSYGVLSIVAFVVATGLWILYQWEKHRTAPYFRERLLATFNFNDKASQWLTSSSTQFARKIPGNQILQLDVDQKEVFLPRLPEALDGFTITHLSDLHLKGHMAQDFYRKVVQQALDLQSEMIMIAGDIFDRDKCFAWAETLGELTADCGTYFILGNHEIRLHDTAMARKVLVEQGMIDLGGRHLSLMIRDYPVLLAGNELPWHPPAADLSTFDASQLERPHFKILLAHTPDQFGWARANDFDLMLAGHNHGGQVRLPVIGPVVSPSRHGTRYAGGMFFHEPTLMHVSRGISGTSPLRWNCKPEITQLVLRTGK